MDPEGVEELTARATAEVLGLVFEDHHPVVVVDSPPGAGKTHLVETVVSLGRDRGGRIAVVAPTNEQAFDLVRRLMDNFRSNSVRLLLAKGRRLPDDLASRHDRRSPFIDAWGDESGHPILVATVSKLGALSAEYPTDRPSFDLLVADEAYQFTYSDFMPVAHLAQQLLLVGDPGQLAPTLSGIDLRRFEAAPVKVHRPAPLELLRRLPDTPRVRLPVSRRLPADTVAIVQPCFYPDMPFESAAQPAEREFATSVSGIGTPIDRAIDSLTSGITVTGLMLDARTTPAIGVDLGVVSTTADLVERLLDRGAEWRGRRRLTPRDIGCVDPHVASNQALREALAARGLPAEQVMVEVPELWQGLERPVMIVKHPLTGERRLSQFALDPGRWCVSLSRHLLGCVIVGRDGIQTALDHYQHDCATRAMGGDDEVWAGVLAHRRLWDDLRSRDRLIVA